MKLELFFLSTTILVYVYLYSIYAGPQLERNQTSDTVPSTFKFYSFSNRMLSSNFIMIKIVVILLNLTARTSILHT